MPAEEALALYLRELEESLLQASVRKSDRVNQLLAEGFVEFGSSGRTFTKEQIICSLRAESPVSITATQFKVELLSPNTALVTYRAHRHSEPPVHTLRSSIWQLQHGDWQMVFHQGTISSAPQ
jgi:hypothetical protein